MPLTPIPHTHKNKAITLACLHWKDFPPVTAGQPVDELVADKRITRAAYQQHQVWQKVCGKTVMDAACGSCSFARSLEQRATHLPPMLMRLDGSGGEAIVDLDFGRFTG